MADLSSPPVKTLRKKQHTVYGRIASGQYAAAGSYTDTITVTVEFHEGL